MTLHAHQARATRHPIRALLCEYVATFGLRHLLFESVAVPLNLLAVLALLVLGPIALGVNQ